MPSGQKAKTALENLHGNFAPEEADVIVALGGDGFMLKTLHETQHLPAPVYGMNRGTVGFLMNEYSENGLAERLAAAEEEIINPLHMTALDSEGQMHEALDINEVSLLRAGPQAAKLRITVDGKLAWKNSYAMGPWSQHLLDLRLITIPHTARLFRLDRMYLL